MELTLDRGGDRPEFSRVKKISKDTNRRSIDVTNDNPILDSRMYEVEYCNGYVAAMEANVIADNLFTKVYQEGNIFVLIKSIIDTRTEGTQILQKNAFIVTKSGTKRRKIELKDGKYASNGRMAVPHEKNLKISRIRIHYKSQSTRLRIEFRRIQH